MSVRLYSEIDLNYSKLQNFLSSGHWKQADIETKDLILKAVPGRKKGWLHPIELLNFPSVDLDSMNRLWLHYSKGIKCIVGCFPTTDVF